MKKYKILTVILIIAIFAGALPVSAAALNPPEVSAVSAVLMNADTGDIMFEKNAGQTMDPAGVTSLMTALLAAEAIKEQSIGLETMVAAGDDVLYNLDGEDAATLDPAIQPGESMTVNELLHCVLLRSAGDACNVLADYIGGSVSDFVSQMNERAEQLGCSSTRFQNANGEPVSNQHTTARDMALIARAAAANTTLTGISSKDSFAVTATNVTGERVLVNSNQLVVPDSENYYGDAYGLKAGYSAQDGYNIVAAASSGGINVVAVVMGCDSGDSRFADAIRLFDWAFDNYSYRSVMSSTETLDSVAVALGTTDSTGVRPESDVELLLPNDQELGDVRFEITYYHERDGVELMAPVNAGESLGEVTVYVDGEVYGTSRLVATSAVDMSRMEYLRSQAMGTFQNHSVRRIIKILVIMLAIYLLLVLFYCAQRVRHLVSLRRARRDRAIARARQETTWLDIPEEEEDDPNIAFFPEEEEPTRSGRGGKSARGGLFRRRRRQEPEVYDDGYDDEYDDEYDDRAYEDEGRHANTGRHADAGRAGKADGNDWSDEYFDEFFKN